MSVKYCRLEDNKNGGVTVVRGGKATLELCIFVNNVLYSEGGSANCPNDADKETRKELGTMRTEGVAC